MVINKSLDMQVPDWGAHWLKLWAMPRQAEEDGGN